MAISDGTLSAADIAAVTNGGFGGGFGGDGAFWIIILFLFCMGGWGNGFGGGYGGGGVPYMVNDVQRGFDQSAVMSGISGIQTSLSNGFAGNEISQCNQTANLTGQLSALALNQATNACNTNANIADLKYVVATEACSDRAAVTDALQVVTNSINNGIQSIKDQLFSDKLDAKNEEIANLRTQINLANLNASQNLQTQQILAGQERSVNTLESYLAPTAIPAYIVQNPNCCTYNTGCGCGGYAG
jgi:hypothetical protein